MTLIYFILVLSITVFIHELGHYIFAKKAKVHVYEFSLGMGPKVFGFKRKNDETDYSIRLFPIGGFVSMAGEEINDDNSIEESKKLYAKSWLQRFSVIVAGVSFNFMLAVILLFIIGLFNGMPENKPIINSLTEGYPIEVSGIKKGDMIVEVNGKSIKSVDRLVLELRIHSGETIKIKVKNEAGTKEVSVTPKIEKVDGKDVYKYGFALESNIEKGLLPALEFAVTKTYNLLEQMVIVITSLVTGDMKLSNLSGPIGIYSVVGESAKAGFINVVYLTALISINVGFINLLPIPAFDGGRLFFLLIEKIKGSKVNPKVENMIHSMGFILLLLLTLIIAYGDILKLLK